MTKTLDDLKRECYLNHPWAPIAPEDNEDGDVISVIDGAIDWLHAQGRIVPDGYVVVSDVVLWAAWRELNAIRARSGVPLDFDGRPQSISEDYFSKLVDDLHDALGDKAQPWAPTNMIAAAQKGDGK